MCYEGKRIKALVVGKVEGDRRPFRAESCVIGFERSLTDSLPNMTLEGIILTQSITNHED